MAVLRFVVEMPDGSAHELRAPDSGEIWIGRDNSCQIVLASREVSRRHLFVQRVLGELRLVDRSANGTWVGERHVQGTEATIAYEERFRVGPYHLRVGVPRDEDMRERGGPVGDLSLPEPHFEPEAPTLLEGHRRPSSAIDELVRFARKARALRSTKYGSSGTGAVSVALRRKMHRMLLDHLDLQKLDATKMDVVKMRPRVRSALANICRSLQGEMPRGTNLEELIEELSHEALGLGPLEELLSDEDVSEIMVVDPQTIFIERGGRLEQTNLRFTDGDSVRAAIERIVSPLGRRIDESSPLVDARLADGSRVNAVIPPLALRGPCITIRKFRKEPLSLKELIDFGTLTFPMARFLVRCVVARQNVVISGGTGSGKTTLLNVLSACIPDDERIVTIEDAAELRLQQPNLVSLEARPPNLEQRGAITIRDLVKNALRMRPDRIVVGECRGGEAIDMLQAMNTGHEGSMTTTHANSPEEALGRLETLALMAGLDLPSRSIRAQLAASIHVVVQQSRFHDGSRRITSISELVGIDEHGELETQEIFGYRQLGTDAQGRVTGEHYATGSLPTFLDDFIRKGLVPDGVFL